MADLQTRLCLASPKIADGLSSPGVSPDPLPPILATGTADYAALDTGPPESRVPSRLRDEAWLFYTSGTTGRPKGAVLTHRNLLFACQCYYADIDFIGPRDTMLHAAPLTHGAGLYGLPIWRGAPTTSSCRARSSPSACSMPSHTYANVSMFAAPTMVSRLLNHGKAGTADTRGLKTISYGGAPMYVADLQARTRAVRPQALPALRPGREPDDHHRPRQGGARRHGHPQLRGAAGQHRRGRAPASPSRSSARTATRLPPGEIGEVVTRSDCVMQGYWNNPEANARDPARRLAVDRRSRPHGRGRLSHPARTAPRT